MAERLGAASRLILVKSSTRGLLVATAVVPLLLAGCGDDGSDSTGSASPHESSSSSSWCRGESAPVRLSSADLDGDGTVEDIDYAPPGGDCPASLSSSVDLVAAPKLDWTTPPTSADIQVVTVPGRPGQLVLLREQHPRGGFQAHLFGYADRKLEELTVGGKPIFPFVATDALSTPLAATCTADGFAVTEARAHQPVGVAPAWDVHRTTYSVDGNTVTKASEGEVADNVLTEDLEAKYANLVNHALFEDCLATG